MGEIDDYTAASRAAWKELRPDEDFTVFDIAMRVQRLAALLATRCGEAVRAHGFTVYGDYAVGAAIRRAGGQMSPSELARELLVTRAGITGRLDRLEHAGFVDRVPSERDARQLVVQLTPLGRRRVDAAFATLQTQRSEVFASLTPNDRQQLAALLGIALVKIEAS
jgi:DNA-binding MarR family transcriptional regulator